MKRNSMMLLRNSVHCNHCNTTLVSRHRHDFVGCKCKESNEQVFIHGGLDYGRLLSGPESDFVNLSIWDEGDHNQRRELLEWGINYDKEMKKLEKTQFKKIKDLNTDHIQAILNGEYAGDFYKEVFKDELKYRIENKIE